jgi:hypothetical protein
VIDFIFLQAVRKARPIEWCDSFEFGILQIHPGEPSALEAGSSEINALSVAVPEERRRQVNL